MKDGLRLSHPGAAIAATDERSLWVGLEDPKSHGEESRRMRWRRKSAVDGEATSSEDITDGLGYIC